MPVPGSVALTRVSVVSREPAPVGSITRSKPIFTQPGTANACSAGASSAGGSSPPASFHGCWHFSSRDEQIAVTLELWEQRDTVDLVDALEAITDPQERLVALARSAYGTATAVPIRRPA